MSILKKAKNNPKFRKDLIRKLAGRNSQIEIVDIHYNARKRDFYATVYVNGRMEVVATLDYCVKRAEQFAKKLEIRIQDPRKSESRGIHHEFQTIGGPLDPDDRR